MRRAFFLLAVLSGGFCNQADAELILARETVIGSGIFDGNPFINALVTLSGTFDTTMVSSNTFFAESLEVTTVTVGTVSDTLTGFTRSSNGISTFFASTDVFSTPGLALGFSTTAADILDTHTTANTGYFLQGPFGPVSGTATIDSGWQFGTATGQFFELDSVSSDATIGFTSGSAAVPEPGSLALACIGILGIAMGVNRKHGHTNPTRAV